MDSKMRFFKLAAAGLLPALAILLSACGSLNRAPIVWITDVKPQFVCPGDSVTLSWDGGTEAGCLGGGCPEVVVSVSSDPADVLGSPLSGLRVRGETSAGPITGPTSFTFSATGGSDRRNPVTHAVDVVLPERETNVPLGFAATCSGSTAVWRDADLSVPEFRSGGVRLVRVCNTSSNLLRLTLGFDSGPQVWTLVPGQCTEDLPPDLGRAVLNARAASLDPIGPPGARCDTMSSLPPDLNLMAALACDIMSASMPIVAAPSESPTPESGIIPLPTFTPTQDTQPRATFLIQANCRLGPGTFYNSIGFGQVGQQAGIEGLSDPAGWYYVLLPDGVTRCFVAGTTVSVTGPLDGLADVPAPPLPEAPALTVSNQVCDSKQYVVRLSWADVTGEAGYRVYRDGALIATLGANVVSYDDVSPDDSPHAYRVEAFNGVGASSSASVNSAGCVY